MRHDVELLLIDVDGTLLTPDKELTAEARAAVKALREAGIRVALTSGRPPRGLGMVCGPLEIDTPVAGFNGGVVVEPDLQTVLTAHELQADSARRAIAVLEEHDLDVWVYTSKRWLIHDPAAPHVARERATVQFDPEVVDEYPPEVLAHTVKIVGVSDDADRVSAGREAAVAALGEDVTAEPSQPYYLDVTHRKANKGEVVAELSRRLGIAPEHIATIGDMPNDIAMFERGGLSIAMGHSSDRVRRAADAVTSSNTDNGFAKAVWSFVLEEQPR